MNIKKFLRPTAESISIVDEMRRAIIVAGAITAALFIGTLQMDIDREGHQDTTKSAAVAMEESKPKNSPSIRTHRAQAEKACKGPVVVPSKKVYSPDVVVVKMNGKVVVMGLDEAFKRVESKRHADNIWVIGACKSHVVKK